MKKERGITLIALVITILILLILAGITLNLALDENGIIRKSQEVVNKYEEAQKDELENLNQLASVLDGRNDENETELKPKLVTNISIKESTTIERGKTEKLDVTIEPHNATNKELHWESNNIEVATVESDGTVTALSGGQAEITVKTTDGSEKSASCTVTVPKTVYDLKLGDYIKYDTGVEEVGENGIVMFRVLYPVDSEYGLQIISNKNIGANISLGDTSTWEAGKTAYNNAISKLNKEAEKYVNEKYASDGRCVGSLPTLENGKFIEKNKGDEIGNFMLPEGWTLPTGWNGRDTGFYDTDNSYLTDREQMWKCSELFWAGGEYWLASRIVGSWESGRYAYFDIRFVDGSTETGLLKAACVAQANSGGELSGYSSGSLSLGLRPCIALKYNEIKIAQSGDGKSESSAYTLEI